MTQIVQDISEKSDTVKYADLILPAAGWMEKEGTSNVTMRFESGALGYHFGTWGARGTRLSYSFHAHCTEGMLEFRLTSDDFETEQLIYHKGGRQEVLLSSGRLRQRR